LKIVDDERSIPSVEYISGVRKCMPGIARSPQFRRYATVLSLHSDAAGRYIFRYVEDKVIGDGDGDVDEAGRGSEG
jgi:hypothetical protein